MFRDRKFYYKKHLSQVQAFHSHTFQRLRIHQKNYM